VSSARAARTAPSLARDTLAYALGTQHAGSDATPYRFPYATTGVGAFSDVGLYSQRSDAYYLCPGSVARYLAVTRDAAFLDEPVGFWPRDAGEPGTVLDHLRRSVDYGTLILGTGAHGLCAMGTGDYADGVTNLTEEPSTPSGTSSSYNAGFVVTGWPLCADLLDARDATLATTMRDFAAAQAAALETAAWNGSYYLRGFVDSGNPLAPDLLFLEPQLFPILAGLIDAARRAAVLALVGDRLESPSGALPRN
jgi:cellobiose phosphorylase